MKKAFPIVMVVLVIALVFTMAKILGGPGEKDAAFYTADLKEGSNTTFIAEPNESDGIVLHATSLYEVRDLKQQAKESTIIVRGRVSAILGTVETKDFGAPIPPVQEQGGKKLHTDVLVEVIDYLGPNTLDFDELVIRHIGGKIDGFTHIYEQEHLTVGDEVIIFRLSQHELMTDVPEGYSQEQYFLFHPASTYYKTAENMYRDCFNNEHFAIDKIKTASMQAPKK